MTNERETERNNRARARESPIVSWDDDDGEKTAEFVPARERTLFSPAPLLPWEFLG